MKPISLFIFAVAAVIFSSAGAQAETIFDVEHARANYRAGLVSEYDGELLRRWGAPSGYYPPSRVYVGPQRRGYVRKRHWRGRRW
jgi:hypothetical protein